MASLRKRIFSAALACLMLAIIAPSAFADDSMQCPCPAAPAYTVSHAAHHAKAHVRKPVKYKRKSGTVAGNDIVRTAQKHLNDLGYYTGKIDGIMGPGTRDAIKNFQRDHGLKTDGVLGPKTRRAFEDADHHQVIGTESELLSRTGFGTAVIKGEAAPSDKGFDQDYEMPLAGGTKTLVGRFARVDVSESGTGPGKRYIVNLNGQPILAEDNQPSVIGMSATYDLGNEDAIIFTTYSPDSTCLYKTHVLALGSSGTRLLDIANCTRYYQAHADGGSLYVTFPEADDNRDDGATWRLDGMSLNRL
jgi:hypothetical protein